MNRVSLKQSILVTAVLLVGCSLTPKPLEDTKNENSFVSGEVIVGFKEGTTSDDMNAVASSINATIATTISQYELLMRFDPTRSVDEVIGVLQASDKVDYAEKNGITTAD